MFCAPNTYYLVNNYGPGFKPDGTPNPPAGPNDFRLPPQTLPTIADSLTANGVAWKYYIGGWNGGKPNANWCSICNPLEFVSSIMTTSQRNNIADVLFRHMTRQELEDENGRLKETLEQAHHLLDELREVVRVALGLEEDTPDEE